MISFLNGSCPRQRFVVSARAKNKNLLIFYIVEQCCNFGTIAWCFRLTQACSIHLRMPIISEWFFDGPFQWYLHTSCLLQPIEKLPSQLLGYLRIFFFVD